MAGESCSLERDHIFIYILFVVVLNLLEHVLDVGPLLVGAGVEAGGVEAEAPVLVVPHLHPVAGPGVGGHQLLPKLALMTMSRCNT